jgi:GNAT superfamily N-acetyltransferase
MLDTRLIKLISADESHYEFAYQVKKAAEGEYITAIWGWNENVQRDFHDKEWKQKKPQIILYEGRSVGTLSVVENEDCIEFGRFFILPECQNMGIGTFLLRGVLNKADKLNRPVRLAHLRNSPVGSLYKRHGFILLNENETHCFMERNPH